MLHRRGPGKKTNRNRVRLPQADIARIPDITANYDHAVPADPDPVTGAERILYQNGSTGTSSS